MNLRTVVCIWLLLTTATDDGSIGQGTYSPQRRTRSPAAHRANGTTQSRFGAGSSADFCLGVTGADFSQDSAARGVTQWPLHPIGAKEQSDEVTDNRDLLRRARGFGSRAGAMRREGP